MSKKIIISILIILGVFVLVFYKLYFKSNSIDKSDVTGKLADILNRGEIIIGIDATYAPLEFKDEQGNFVGMDIDVAKEIAKDLGVKIKFVDIPFDDIFQAIKDDQIDMSISSITITAERAEMYGFSDPYFNAGQIIVSTLNSKKTINGPQDLKGLRIGAQLNTTSDLEAKKYAASPADIYNFEEYNSAKDDLLAGKIDAIIIDYPAGFSMVAKDNRLVIKGEIFTQEFYGVATQKNELDLLLQINETIRKLKQDGTLKQLEDKWLGQ